LTPPAVPKFPSEVVTSTAAAACEAAGLILLSHWRPRVLPAPVGDDRSIGDAAEIRLRSIDETSCNGRPSLVATCGTDICQVADVPAPPRAYGRCELRKPMRPGGDR
jgi:hypothetical protein